jgi:hypothetical protein
MSRDVSQILMAAVARVKILETALREIQELLAEEDECDCPPEWPRCAICRSRLKAQVALDSVEINNDNG